VYKRKSKKLRADKVGIEGHYETEKTAHENGRVWVPDQLVVECSCGTKMRPAGYPNVCECGADYTALVHEMELVLAENSISLQCCAQEGERSTRTVYKSDDILRSLTSERSKVPGANAAIPAADAPRQSIYGSATLDNETSPSFCLEDAIVVGNLDLKYRTVERPIVARNCWFMGTVDLRYCEFKQAVYFLDCTFYQAFNSGDTIESHTIYRKELNCIGSQFKKAASFNGIQVESTAYFHNTRFELQEPEKSTEYPSLSETYTVDFATSSFGDHLECRDAVFRGYVSFNSISCGSTGQFISTCFEKGANFTAASFDWHFDCTKAKFMGPATFNSLRCDGSGRIEGVSFKDEADFTAASFSRNFDCIRAKFNGPVYFNSLRCGGVGFLDRVHFEKEVDLRYSAWTSPLVCRGSTFCGKVDCSEMSCAHDGIFNSTQFESGERVVFAGAKFGGALQCEGAVFKGRVDFSSLKCDGAGHFRNATFVNDEVVDYRHSHFGGDLDLRCAYFAGRVRLSQVTIKNKLRLGASCFKEEAELYDSDIKILELIDANYHLETKHPLEIRTTEEPEEFATIVETKDELERIFKPITFRWVASKLKTRKVRGRKHTVEKLFPFKPNKVTLTGISFERFHGGPNRELAWELALRFCEGQDPTKFSRDPYLQLKKYYSSIGEDDDALDIHYRGRCALRENAKASRSRFKTGRVHWSRLKMTTDFIWKLFTGYGQKMHRLLLAFLFFVTLGTIFFWSQATLTLPPGAEEATKKATKEAIISQQGAPKLVDRMVYSADLLIPVLDLRAGDTRIAENSVMWFYEVVQIFAGWLLIALLIAWITAVAKGDR
jgi:hypothetical protein